MYRSKSENESEYLIEIGKFNGPKTNSKILLNESINKFKIKYYFEFDISSAGVYPTLTVSCIIHCILNINHSSNREWFNGFQNDGEVWWKMN